MTDYLILFLIVFGVNLMPAFGPPTWVIIVFYSLNSALPPALLVPIAALAAASGRLLLAHGTRLLGEKFLPQATRRNLEAARQLMQRRKSATAVALGLFALSPVPSAQLFEAAGLARVRLLWFTTAFFAGRLVSYAIYAAAATGLEGSTLGQALRENFGSIGGVALEIAMIVIVIGLTQIDWKKWLPGDEQWPTNQR